MNRLEGVGAVSRNTIKRFDEGKDRAIEDDVGSQRDDAVMSGTGREGIGKAVTEREPEKDSKMRIWISE